MGFAAWFYQSDTWRRNRKAFMESKHWLCEDCLSRGLITPATEAHHIVHLTPANINDPRISLNWSNLAAVCKPCHDERHRQDRPDKHRFTVDSDGKIIF